VHLLPPQEVVVAVDRLLDDKLVPKAFPYAHDLLHTVEGID